MLYYRIKLDITLEMKMKGGGMTCALLHAVKHEDYCDIYCSETNVVICFASCILTYHP